MAFKRLQDFFDAEIELPIGDKTYVIKSPDAETGLMCQNLMAGAATIMTGGELTDKDAEKLTLDDDDEQDLYKRIMGEAWDEMFTDKVPWTLIKHAGTTSLVWITQGREEAEEFWSAGPAPKEKQPTDHKAPAKKTSTTPRKSASSRKKSSGDPRKKAATAGASS
jgi:hypothetical protein